MPCLIMLHNLASIGCSVTLNMELGHSSVVGLRPLPVWILLISVFSLYSLLPAGLDMEVSFLPVEVVSLKINTTYMSLVTSGPPKAQKCQRWFHSRKSLFDLILYVQSTIFRYKWTARIKVSYSRTQHSDAGEAQTCGPSVSSQALYH